MPESNEPEVEPEFDLETSQYQCVYFIGCEGMDIVKIGYASNIVERFSNLQTSSPCKLRLLGYIPGGTLITEKVFHNVLKKHRVRGEWFQLNTDVLGAISRCARKPLNERPNYKTLEEIKLWSSGNQLEDVVSWFRRKKETAQDIRCMVGLVEEIARRLLVQADILECAEKKA